jgi:hypothetical protein
MCARALDDGLVNVLRRSSARYAEERLALGAAHAGSGYVAVNEAGEPYTGHAHADVAQAGQRGRCTPDPAT